MDYDLLGFEHQDWFECGVYSFGHTMNLLGEPVTIEECKKLAKYTNFRSALLKELKLKNILSPRETIEKIWVAIGTEEKGIISGIKKKEFKPFRLLTGLIAKARKFLDNQLLHNYPVILAVNWDYTSEDLGHWIVCGGEHKNKYLIIDSAPSKNKIISYYSWNKLLDRFKWIDEDGQEYYEFNMIAISSRSTISTVNKIGLMNKHLQENWGNYLSDLLEISDNKGKEKLSFLLKKYSKHFSELLPFWFEDIEKSETQKEIENYIKVSEANDFKILEKNKDIFLISFASWLIGAPIY